MSDGFRINKAYAEKYNTWRQKEELQKLKDKYTGEEDSEDSTSSESEDEDAEALTDQLEKDWLRTLSALKSKDPKIYQKDVKFYKEEDTSSSDDAEQTKKKKQNKDKPMYLKDYERKVILEKGGVVSDDEDSEEERPSASLAYHQEQEQLRKSIVAAAHADSDSEDTDTEHIGLLKKRVKTAAEKEKEEFEYLEWLKGQKDSLETEKEIGTELEPLKKYWQNKNLDEGEKFLKNYILNRQYIDKDDESMPTYDEIVQDEEEDFSEDEELLTKQENFERKYNFRFEEPDAAEVKTFPRNFEDTLRRKDTKRAEKRKEVEERKKQEKEKKKDELKQLKKLKRQEIMDKIEKLKEITGNKKLAFEELDLEDDFDPAKHDQMMQKYFDEEYYGEEENEDMKPVFEMSDDEIENWDNWTGAGEENEQGGEYYEGGADNYGDGDWNEGPSAEDPDFIMDADYDPVADMERKKSKKEKKRKNKLTQALATKKPVFDPNEKTFEEYFDEYYKLDYEDIIDDMPCRFKYRKVTPNNYGLTVDEILKSRDKELNAWASIKKMSQYRTQEEEQRDIQAYQAKGRNERKKKNILTSLYESEEKDDEAVKPTPNTATTGESQSKKKRKKKRGKKKQKIANSGDSNTITSKSGEKEGNKPGTKRTADEVETTENEENLEREFVKIKKRKIDDSSADSGMNTDTSQEETPSQELTPSQERSPKKKKKKHKRSHGDDTNNKLNTSQSSESERITANNPIVENYEKEKHSDSTELNKEKKTAVHTNMNNSKSFAESVVASKEADVSKTNNGGQVSEINKKKKKKKNKKKKDGQKLQLSEERLKAYGINPKKYKYMKKEDMFQIKPRNQGKNAKT